MSSIKDKITQTEWKWDFGYNGLNEAYYQITTNPFPTFEVARANISVLNKVPKMLDILERLANTDATHPLILMEIKRDAINLLKELNNESTTIQPNHP